MFTKLLPEQIQTKRNFIRQYVNAQTAADGSLVDANANITTKNIATLATELHKDFNMQINRSIMYDMIKEMFGEIEAINYLKELEHHFIYHHDQTGSAIPIPYCASITLYPLLIDGLLNLGGESKAPHNPESFCDIFIQLISTLAGQFSGAIAAPEFLLFANYFFEKEYGSNYIETNLRDIDNHIQGVIYNSNHPAAAKGFQSIFLNFAVYDKYFMESLFGKFMFPDGSKPNFENLNKLQLFFLDWIRREREVSLLTFPVITAAVLNENGKPKDDIFYKHLSIELSKGNSFFIYQSDTIDALSSCCFTGEQYVLISEDKNKIFLMPFKNAYEISKDWKECFIYHKGSFNPGKVIKISNHNKRVFRIITEDKKVLKATEDHIHVTTEGDLPTGKLTKNHSLKIWNEHKKCEESAKIYSISEIEYNHPVYCAEMKDDPYFTLANGIITHNCRLRNSIETNDFSYTLGNVGVMTGSVCVMTLNLNRFIQKHYQEFLYRHEAFIEGSILDSEDTLKSQFMNFIKGELEEQIRRIHKYQAAFRYNIKDEIEKGILPAYTAGFIALDKQFSTIGINGLTEACEFLKLKITNNSKYINFTSKLLKIISDTNKESAKQFGIKFNTEFVPAENLGVKNAKWDKEDGYHVTRDCYNSYFFPVESDINDVVDKFILHGKEMTQYLDGGSALHLNLEEHLSPDQYMKLFEIAAKTGCYYWTVNVLTTICKACGKIIKQKVTKCCKCGSDDVEYATRIIGYLKRISNFSKARREEASKRFYHGSENREMGVF